MDRLIKNLKKRNFDAFFFNTREEAVKYLLSEFEDNRTISWGGSVTLNELGIKELLKTKKMSILDRDHAGSPEEKRQIQLDSFDSDYYLMSTNAITKAGELVNIDGTGNRLASLIYGPKAVYVISGTNKVCETESDALNRVRKFVAPRNVKRLGLKTPCAEKGECQDCLSEQCICNHIVVTRRSWTRGRIKVILINENLGI